MNNHIGTRVHFAGKQGYCYIFFPLTPINYAFVRFNAEDNERYMIHGCYLICKKHKQDCRVNLLNVSKLQAPLVYYMYF